MNSVLYRLKTKPTSPIYLFEMFLGGVFVGFLLKVLYSKTENHQKSFNITAFKTCLVLQSNTSILNDNLFFVFQVIRPEINGHYDVNGYFQGAILARVNASSFWVKISKSDIFNFNLLTKVCVVKALFDFFKNYIWLDLLSTASYLINNEFYKNALQTINFICSFKLSEFYSKYFSLFSVDKTYIQTNNYVLFLTSKLNDYFYKIQHEYRLLLALILSKLKTPLLERLINLILKNTFKSSFNAIISKNKNTETKTPDCGPSDEYSNDNIKILQFKCNYVFSTDITKPKSPTMWLDGKRTGVLFDFTTDIGVLQWKDYIEKRRKLIKGSSGINLDSSKRSQAKEDAMTLNKYSDANFSIRTSNINGKPYRRIFIPGKGWLSRTNFFKMLQSM